MTDLGDKMRALADTSHPRHAELREAADKFDAAANAAYAGSGPVSKMVGTWARARRIYCECTGESLI